MARVPAAKADLQFRQGRRRVCDGDRLILCGVTKVALKDAASLRRATVASLLELYEIHKVRIHLIAGAKYRMHRYDAKMVSSS
jgi:archaellum biogenesis ATPase FlaH